MVTVCLQCGDRGFFEALIYCDKCKAYAVHRYCLPILPATFEEDVVWFCEDCELKVVKPSTLDKTYPLSVSDSDSESLESFLGEKRNFIQEFKKRKAASESLSKSEVLRLKNHLSQELLEFHCTEDGKKDWELGRQDGLDFEKGKKYLELGGRLREENFHEGTESLKTNNSLVPICDLEPIEVVYCEEEEKGVKLVRQNSLDEFSVHEKAESVKTENSQLTMGDVEQCGKLGRKNSLDECSVQETAESLESKNSPLTICDVQPCHMNYCKEGEKRENLQRNKSLDGDNFHDMSESNKTNSQIAICDIQPLKVVYCEDGEKNQKVRKGCGLNDKNLDEEAESNKTTNYQLAIYDASTIVKQNYYAHAQPIKEPIWRGTLSIFNKSFASFGGLVAHLSSIACSRVSEEAKLLPRLLATDLLPRCAVWPKGFAKQGPSYDSIALYFFPDSERNEKVFDKLVVDMIRQDLAIRAVVQNAELLIFTSTVLPMECWRFQAKLYLWGVFRKKQHSSEALHVPADERGPVDAISLNVRSPVSPLSNGSHGFGSMNSLHLTQMP